MSKFKLCRLTALLLILPATVVPAATVSFDVGFSFTNPTSSSNSLLLDSIILSNNSQGFSASSSSLALAKFDSSLGTLNSALIEVSLTASSTSGSATFGSLGLITEASIARMLSLTIDDDAFEDPVNSSSATITTPTLLSSLGLPVGGGTGVYTSIAGPSGFSYSVVDGEELSALTGADGEFFNSTLNSRDTIALSKLLGIGSYTLSAISSYSGTLKITYDYTAAPVPEPSTYAAITGALVLWGALFRRRRQVA